MFAKYIAAMALAAVTEFDAPVDLELPDIDEHRRGLVSVVIPTYNRAYIVGDAIRSVLDQSYKNVEVIVVDDGSQDSTPELVKDFGPQVRYFRQENAGVCAARNLGLRHSRGEFIALLDSDDAWLPWKLASEVAVLEKFPEVGMIWTDMIAVDDRGRHLDDTYLRRFYIAHERVRIENVLRPVGPLRATWPDAPAEVSERPVYCGDLFSSMILGNLVHTSTVLIRRRRLAEVGGFDLSLKRSGEDYEFHLRTCAKGPVAFLDASSILYRVGAGDQLTAPEYRIDMARNNLTTVQRWIAIGGRRVSLDDSTVRNRLAESHAWLGEQEFLAGQALSGREHLRTSLQLGKVTGHRLAMFAFTFLPRAVFDFANSCRKAVRKAVAPAPLFPWKSVAKRWLRPVLTPGVRAVVRYAPSQAFQRFAWNRVAAPFFQHADYNFVARTRFGALLAGNTADLIQRHVYYFGVWERNLTDFLAERLSEGDIFVDVGANIGYFTLQASGLVGKKGKVVSIEASPAIFALLRANIERNGVTNVESLNLAASDSEGSISIYLADSRNIGQTSIIESESSRYECEVETRPLDKIINPIDLGRVRVIKIDVEGAEALVVAGMHAVLAEGSEKLEVVIEISPKRLHRLCKRAEDIIEIFGAYGFKPYALQNSYSDAAPHEQAVARPRRIREPITAQVDVVFSRQDVEEL